MFTHPTLAKKISLMLQISGTQLQLPLRAAKFLSGIPKFGSPTWAIGLENATTILVSEKRWHHFTPQKNIEMNMFGLPIVDVIFCLHWCYNNIRWTLYLETLFQFGPSFCSFPTDGSRAKKRLRHPKVSHSPLPLLSGEFLGLFLRFKMGVGMGWMGSEIRNGHLGWK